MKALRLFAKNPLFAPFVLCTFLPLSFAWTSDSGFMWMFWPKFAIPAAILLVGGGVCALIAAWRTKGLLSSSAN